MSPSNNAADRIGLFGDIRRPPLYVAVFFVIGAQSGMNVILKICGKFFLFNRLPGNRCFPAPLST